MKFKSTIMIMLFCIVLSGCASQTQKSSISQIPNDNVIAGEINYKNVRDIISTMEGSAERSKIFNDLGELVSTSNAIIEGTVQDIYYFEKGNVTYTKFITKISHSYWENLKPVDLVSVIEPGGYAPLSKYIKLYGKDRFPDVSEKEANTKYVKSTFDGKDVTQVGENVLLFLWQDKENTWGLSSDFYYVEGFKDGKFNIDDTSVERKSKDPSNIPLKMEKSTYKNIIFEIVKDKKQ